MNNLTVSPTDDAVYVGPPFVEADVVSTERERAVRLAKSDLPILILGEPGTGRRTLATALATLRARDSGLQVLRVEGVRGIDGLVRETVSRKGPLEVVVYDLHLLPAQQQLELAHWVRSREIRLVAVGKATASEEGGVAQVANVVPELEMEMSPAQVALPPLRDREIDVLQWANLFLDCATKRLQLSTPEFTAGCKAAIRRHRWPGNLIELDAVINRTLCLSFKLELEAADLGLADGEDAIIPLNEAVERFRNDYIARALAHFSGNRSQTARALKVDVRTVFRHLEGRRK